MMWRRFSISAVHLLSDARSALRRPRISRRRSSAGKDYWPKSRARPQPARRGEGAPPSNPAASATMFAAEDSGHYTSRVMQDIWETVSSARHFANAHLEVVTEHVRTPSCSQPRAWTIVHRKAAVIIAPMTRDGKIVLIHQERIPIRTAIWEMPAGQIDNAVTPPSRGHVAGVGLSAVASAKVDDPGHRAAKKIEQVALRELRE